jgi:hypothetical protein
MVRACGNDAAYGGFASVEPIRLPSAGSLPVDCADGCCAQAVRRLFIESDLDLLRDLSRGGRPGRLRAPADGGKRARYRWMIGHHAAFGVWICLRHALNSAMGEPAGSAGSIDLASQLYDAYSVLFLYSGSCTAERYASSIRAEMVRHHPAFSGEWAADYVGLPVLTRQVLKHHSPDAVAPLAEAVRRNRQAHAAVAQRLVPGGKSLLQQSGRRPGGLCSQADHDTYDEYFAVRRSRVCALVFSTQITRRLAQVACDISEHGWVEPGSSLFEADAADVADAESERALKDAAPQLLNSLAEVIGEGNIFGGLAD